ncbi:MAG: PTS fructose transporter subunit IIA [Gammaproteobacteria bacterium]
MTIGLLIVTHNNIGNDLVDTATAMLGVCPLATEILAVSQNCDPEMLRRKAKQLITALDQGNGVLVLTDIYGSTPSNIAGSLMEAGRVEVVSGINLPMLIRVLNYPRLSLGELTEKAVSGGKDGILCRPRALPKQ